MATSATSEDEDEYISDHQSTSEDDDDDEWPPRQPPSQNFFGPPFYGRPPTPLPPSPSLTSLLRPSRPTTPDASDSDAEAPVHARAAPTVPTHEYYGFVLYLFSGLTFLTYLLWSYLPAPFLHALGIRYYPNRWWALAVPAFLVMGLVYTYVALAAYNTEVLTAPLSRLDTIVDGAGKVAVVDSKGRLRYGAVDGDRGHATAATAAASSAGANGSASSAHREKESKREKDGRLRWREIWAESTDAVLDIPLGGVCEVLYGEGRHR